MMTGCFKENPGTQSFFL
jgi:hypothetical protein